MVRTFPRFFFSVISVNTWQGLKVGIRLLWPLAWQAKPRPKTGGGGGGGGGGNGERDTKIKLFKLVYMLMRCACS